MKDPQGMLDKGQFLFKKEAFKINSVLPHNDGIVK